LKKEDRVETHPRQLLIPEPALSDPKAIEILRVWAAGGKQHVSLATGIWEDPAAWGIMLVDLANHVAIAYEQSRGLGRRAVLEKLRAGFDAEWNSPTDKPTGGIKR
jgi:hypothetical protein